MTRPLLSTALAAALCAVPALVTAGPQSPPEVSRSTIWIGTVQRGDLVTEVRGPGELERFGRGFHARTRIAARQARDVQLDQTATVDTRSEVLAGRVVHIADRVEEGTVVVVVEVTGETPAGLRPGLSLDVRIQTGLLEDVLIVERPAFGQTGETTGLFRLTGSDEAERVPVTFGTSSVDRIVVTAGLEPGDRIILSDMARYAAADRIRLVD